MKIDTIEEVVQALQNGEIVIVTDDPDRENEGDFICAAEFATPENINIMAKEGRGLICMPMSKEYGEKLGLDQMVANNTDYYSTAFTVSIDHIETTTGISAYERSLTAIKATEDGARSEDFRRPGHMFPLIAKDKGVLVRDGHTEATVDLMKLAGLKEIGICCEIMGDDGKMLVGKEIFDIAKRLNMKVTTIEELIKYRKGMKENVKLVAEADLNTIFGKFRMIGFEDKNTHEEHVALVKGDIGNGKDILVRVHSECLTGDTFGSLRCDCGDQLYQAMEQINKEGRGILLYMRQEGRGIGLLNKIKAYNLQDQGLDTLEANVKLGFEPDERDYSVGANILESLGVKEMRLLTNNPDKIYSLEQYGIKIIERVPIEIKSNEVNRFYQETKAKRFDHLLKEFKEEV